MAVLVAFVTTARPVNVAMLVSGVRSVRYRSLVRCAYFAVIVAASCIVDMFVLLLSLLL